MTVVETERSWTNQFAGRTRGDVGGGLAAILALSGRTDIISFAGGLPDPETMPDARLAGFLRAMLEAGDASPLQYSPVKGLPGPLDYLAGRLMTREGRRPAVDELMITSGCVEALELLGKTFLDPGDVVVVEAPSYLGATMGFKSFGAEVVEVPLDEHGVRTDALETALAAEPRPKFFYTIPDFQNPTGLTLSGPRREEVVALARRYGVAVIEDVTYRELHFGVEQPPSLWGLQPDMVIQIGTFSKTFFPGVRLGWAVGPAAVIAQMILAKQNTDQCAGALGQRLLEEFGRSGELDRQIERARDFYRHRRDLLLDALQRHMPEGVSWTRPEGGFVTWLTLPVDVDADGLAQEALDEAVAFVPGSVFFARPGARRNYLRLSYSLVADDEMEEGIRRLGALLRRALGTTKGERTMGNGQRMRGDTRSIDSDIV